LQGDNNKTNLLLLFFVFILFVVLFRTVDVSEVLLLSVTLALHTIVIIQ
jgi:hypothetical protein